MIDIVTEIYTDGSSMGNPGKAGYGYVIKYYNISDNAPPEKNILTGSQCFRLSTNNRMEMLAAIKALEQTYDLFNEKKIESNRVKLYSDSKLLVDGINQNWINKWKANNWINTSKEPVKNKDLWEWIHSLIYDYKIRGINLQFNWIKGHDGFEYNELADSLATEASASNKFEIDEIYEAEDRSLYSKIDQRPKYEKQSPILKYIKNKQMHKIPVFYLRRQRRKQY